MTPGAIQYEILIRTVDGTPVFDQVYAAAAVCSGDVCSLNPGLSFSPGMYVWLARIVSETATVGEWSAELTFTVYPPATPFPPADLPPVSPGTHQPSPPTGDLPPANFAP